MATSCLKRSSRLKELQPPQPRLNELICPICRTILREPVTLPCSHNLCLRCLRGTVQHNSLTCPLCRQRVGSWLRSATKTESLVNHKLWQHIRDRYPQELELAATSSNQNVDFDDGFIPKTILSAAGDIRKEYEAQLQIAEEEMRRQQEKERLASEALIQKLQAEEKQKKFIQLVQDQLLAKTLAKEDAMEKTNNRYQRSNRSSTLVNLAISKSNAEESKPTKTKARSKNTANARKQNAATISNFKPERSDTNSKTNSTIIQEETPDVSISHKPVPIHNAVTRVVTHQNRDELTCSTSKIYGLQSKEELHVPSDLISSKKKKLGVEVCVTNIEGEERIGSAESAGSHDSINQEIHHFKPIKALPRTPLKTTKEGKQCDPKLIRVLPIYKKGSNAVPKPPSQTHLKKILGCSWSAFKRISKQQVLQKDSTSVQPQETKTDKKSFLSHDVTFDSNDNYTKNINKTLNGTKVSKKLNMDDQMEMKPGKRINKLKNGLILGKYKSQKEINSQKVIEVVDLADDDPTENLTNETITKKERTPDPLAFTPKTLDDRPMSPVFDIIENIAERIKRRKATRTTSNSENVQSAINQVPQTTAKAKTKTKKPAIKKVRNPKQTKAASTPAPKSTTTAVTNKAKTKTKAVITTAITSHIKKLAARSSKRPRYTEDSESEEDEKEEEEEVEEEKVLEPIETESNEEQKRLEATEDAELDKSDPSPSPSKKPKKTVRAPRKSKPRKIVQKPKTPVLDDEELIKEQERLERLAAQEREDQELAKMLQDQFNAMERVAGRTRRGAANRPPSPILDQLPVSERRPQKRALVQ